MDNTNNTNANSSEFRIEEDTEGNNPHVRDRIRPPDPVDYFQRSSEVAAPLLSIVLALWKLLSMGELDGYWILITVIGFNISALSALLDMVKCFLWIHYRRKEHDTRRTYIKVWAHIVAIILSVILAWKARPAELLESEWQDIFTCFGFYYAMCSAVADALRSIFWLVDRRKDEV